MTVKAGLITALLSVLAVLTFAYDTVIQRAKGGK